ncbi:hypothetical protein KEM52_002575, partial [Ascosphaera acerosa]
MHKRGREAADTDSVTDGPARKRQREDSTSKTDDASPPAGADYISALSNELLFLILSYLPASSLITCSRISRRFHHLADDSELWKRKYYSRWVWPRARRLRQAPTTEGAPRAAAAANTTAARPSYQYTPHASRWLGHAHLSDRATPPHWKQQYHLRHNWANGTCTTSQTQ